MADIQSFEERIGRITAGQQWEPEGVIVAQHTSRKKKARKSLFGNAGYPLSIVMAFVLGILTVVLARYCRFHLFGVEQSGDIIADHLIMDAAMSSGLAFVIRMATNLKSPVHLSAKSFGITAGVLTMHMAVHRFPEIFDFLFSPQWTDLVIASTEANGILFFSFGG